MVRIHIPKAQKEQWVTMSRTMNPEEIADATLYSRRAVQRALKNYRETGDVTGRPQTGRPRKLTSLDLNFLESLIERDCAIQLHDMQTALEELQGVEVDRSTISRQLKKRGFTQKKPSVAAQERNEENRRAWHQQMLLKYPNPNMFVFADESGANRYTGKPKLAWAPSGDRARRRDVFVRGKRHSILPAISLEGVLHVDVIDQAWNADSFYDFVDALLDKMGDYPAPNSVLVMDNASIHHSEDIRILVETRGKRLEYLPPYSPDFNPIEEGFSTLKSWLARNRDYMLAEMDDRDFGDPAAFLINAVHETMTPDNILGWFNHSCYL